MNAKEHFEIMIKKHVEQPLNVYDMLIKFAKLVAPNSQGIKKLEKEEYWRPFMPPLYNYIITCIEVSLEKYFFEQYFKPDGSQYSNYEEWNADFSNFKALFTWPNKSAENQIRKPFSFQRLPAVEVLFSVVLNKIFGDYAKYDVIKIMFSKRHLFVHRGGFVDQKFLNEYNAFHKSDPSQRLSTKDIGKIAYLKKEWVRDSIEEAKAFVDFICN